MPQSREEKLAKKREYNKTYIKKKKYDNKTPKQRAKDNWAHRGVDMTNFDEVYDLYINTHKCDLCDKIFENSFERVLEHNHTTGEIRNIVCRKCNTNKEDNSIRSDNKTDHKNIKKCNGQYKQGFYYRFEIKRDGKSIKRTRKTLEEIIVVRDKYLEENKNLYK